MEEEPNPKFKLYGLLQRLLRRQPTSTDIVVSHQSWEVGIQATVTLACAEGREASGELCQTNYEAEESAFQQALLIYEDELKELVSKLPPAPLVLPTMPTPKASVMKRQAAGAGMVVRPPKRTKVEVVEESVALEAPEPSLALTNESAGTADGASAANGDAPQSINSPEELVLSLATPKSKPGRPENVASAPSSPPVLGPKIQLANKDLAKQELIGLVSKIRRVPMKKGDVAYEHHLVVGGYQATVQIRCLDGDWKDAAFVGEVCRDKNMAEHSAAAVAVAELRVDHRLMLRASAPKKQPQVSNGWAWWPRR